MVVNPELDVPIPIQTALCAFAEQHLADLNISIEQHCGALIVAVARRKSHQLNSEYVHRLVITRSRLGEPGYVDREVRQFYEKLGKLAKAAATA